MLIASIICFHLSFLSSGDSYTMLTKDKTDNSTIYFANIIIKDFDCHVLSIVTTGDEGRAIIPDLPDSFVIEIQHTSYESIVDTVYKDDPRHNVTYYMMSKD
jgi:hypothetical protein